MTVLQQMVAQQQNTAHLCNVLLVLAREHVCSRVGIGHECTHDVVCTVKGSATCAYMLMLITANDTVT